MRVSDCMTRDVRTISPERTIQEAAGVMATLDAGAIPVGENDRLVGMITDRDISVRAVAKGMDCSTPVREVMTQDIRYCFEDEDVEHVAHNMGEIQVRRLPVLDRDKRLVGIIALGDLAIGPTDRQAVGSALGGVSRNGGAHA
ncbi:CBS domain-containing protein [Sinimarinibacterium flocculans]|uniref:CBS domain-containing protein n=1 Tax=Sinimarinibacterium flocculans TaxID=985250 RepID=UPI00344FFE5E